MIPEFYRRLRVKVCVLRRAFFLHQAEAPAGQGGRVIEGIEDQADAFASAAIR